MSKREKTVTLFSKNHISVIKKENMNNPEEFVRIEKISNKYQFRKYKMNWWNQYTVNVIKESPLGFLYEEKEKRYKGRDMNSSTCEEKQIVYLFRHNYMIEIVYPISYNNVEINVDLRPWQLIDEKSMPDHFILDLKKVIDDILSEILEDKLEVCTREEYFNYSNPDKMITYNELKDMLYEDLFGSTKGIRFQTDLEKIDSHGFDKVTSFRNM